MLFGVAPTGQDAAILTALAKTLPSTPYGSLAFTANAGLQNGVSPFVTNDEVRALFASGDTASALSLLQRLWGYMDAPGPDYTGADWELVGPNGAPGFGDETSLAHGWSSGATADLSSCVLGVRPTKAGFDTWSVDPHPGSLSWAEGNVPTPHGTIEVRWAQQRSSGRFALQVTAALSDHRHPDGAGTVDRCSRDGRDHRGPFGSSFQEGDHGGCGRHICARLCCGRGNLRRRRGAVGSSSVRWITAPATLPSHGLFRGCTPSLSISAHWNRARTVATRQNGSSGTPSRVPPATVPDRRVSRRRSGHHGNDAEHTGGEKGGDNASS